MHFVKKIAGFSILCFALVGCADDNNNNAHGDQDGVNSQPINYETQQEQEERLGNEGENKNQDKYPKSDQKELNRGDRSGQSDLYTNEMTMSISDKLKKRKHIQQAQVTMTKDKLVVAVIISEYAPSNIGDKVEEEVREMAPNKEVVVYTDDPHWDRMRNKDAQLDQLKGGVKEFLNEFFNRERED